MKKILLVNTFNTVLEQEKSILGQEKYLLLTATTAEEAIGVHQAEQMDIIIADMDLHDLPGDELCARMRRDIGMKQVSFVLVCHNTERDMERVARCGANAWVTKPLRPDQLIERVAQLLSVSARRSYRVLLRVKAVDSHEEQEFFCTSRNISASGILFESETILHLGDRITCSFYLPGMHRIVTDGHIARLTQRPDGIHHYGVRFTDLSHVFRVHIEEFVAADQLSRGRE